MKNYTLISIQFCVILLVSGVINAQAPQSFNYQGLVRSKDKQPVVNQIISLRLSIVKEFEEGKIVYQEEQKVRTDPFGIFSIQVGNGKVLEGKMEDVPWSEDLFFLRTEVDLEGEEDYEEIGITQFQSVPYALYAARSGSAPSNENTEHSDNQTLLLNGDSLSISNGNSIDLSPLNLWKIVPDVGMTTSSNDIQHVFLEDDNGYLSQMSPKFFATISPDHSLLVGLGHNTTAGPALNLTDTLNNGFYASYKNGIKYKNNSIGAFRANSSDIRLSNAQDNHDVLWFGRENGDGKILSFTENGRPLAEMSRSDTTGFIGTFGLSDGTYRAALTSFEGVDAGAMAIFNKEVELALISPGPEGKYGQLYLEQDLNDGDYGPSIVLTPYGDSSQTGVYIFNNTASYFQEGLAPLTELKVNNKLGVGELLLKGKNTSDNLFLGSSKNDSSDGLLTIHDDMGMEGVSLEIDAENNGLITAKDKSGNIHSDMSYYDGAGSMNIYLDGDIIAYMGRSSRPEAPKTGEFVVSDNTGNVFASLNVAYNSGILALSKLQNNKLGTIVGLGTDNSGKNGLFVYEDPQQFAGVPLPKIELGVSSLARAGELALYGLNDQQNIALTYGFNENEGMIVLSDKNSIGKNTLFIDQLGAGSQIYTGDNGKTNVFIGSNAGNGNNGRILIMDEQGTSQVAMYVNNDGKGVISSDLYQNIIDHPNKANVQIAYSMLQGPEAASYLRGTAKLVNGTVVISLPDYYSGLITDNNITVMITPLSDESKGMAVLKKSSKGFVVKELFNGTGNYEFDWEIKATRKGYENRPLMIEKSNNGIVNEPNSEQLRQREIAGDKNDSLDSFPIINLKDKNQLKKNSLQSNEKSREYKFLTKRPKISVKRADNFKQSKDQ